MKKQINLKSQNDNVIKNKLWSTLMNLFLSKVREYTPYCFLKLNVSSNSVGTAIVNNWCPLVPFRSCIYYSSQVHQHRVIERQLFKWHLGKYQKKGKEKIGHGKMGRGCRRYFSTFHSDPPDHFKHRCLSLPAHIFVVSGHISSPPTWEPWLGMFHFFS